MYVTTQNFTPLQTVFGGGYVPEQHGDETCRYLPRLYQNSEILTHIARRCAEMIAS